MDDGRERCVHVLRGSELFDRLQSSVYLIAHGRNDIIARNFSFLIDQSFTPDLGIELLTRLEVFANIVLLLCDS